MSFGGLTVQEVSITLTLDAISRLLQVLFHMIHYLSLTLMQSKYELIKAKSLVKGFSITLTANKQLHRRNRLQAEGAVDTRVSRPLSRFVLIFDVFPLKYSTQHDTREEQ